jgi:mannose-6-phosphate isomerase-like protein (cupin superfamily)
MVGVARLLDREVGGLWEQHDGGDEYLVIVAGRATLRFRDRGAEVEVAVTAGDLVTIPVGIAHSFSIEEGELHLLYVTPLEGNQGWASDGRAVRRHP